MWDDGGAERKSCERTGVCGVGCSPIVVKRDVIFSQVNPPQVMEISWLQMLLFPRIYTDKVKGNV